MANNVNMNPIRIDTFGADVIINSGQAVVNSIVMEGASAGDTAVFIDTDGEEVLRLSNSADGASAIWSPAAPHRFKSGLIFDDSASSLSAGDFVFIFLV